MAAPRCVPKNASQNDWPLGRGTSVYLPLLLYLHAIERNKALSLSSLATAKHGYFYITLARIIQIQIVNRYHITTC